MAPVPLQARLEALSNALADFDRLLSGNPRYAELIKLKQGDVQQARQKAASESPL